MENLSKLEKLQRLALDLPERPGCYILKKIHIETENDEILYVGKAKNLKKRVSSYFRSKNSQPRKTQILVSKVSDIDFIIVENEAEALILENNLIKKYSPKYNMKLKDDKSYPYVIVEMSEIFPRISIKRRITPKKNRKKYGPFVDSQSLWKTVDILIKSFALRDCSLSEFKKRKNPCLLHQMEQCSAPCVGLISSEDYSKTLLSALNIFEGKGDRTINLLEEKMFLYSKQEKFELAAQTRDFIFELKKFMDKSQQKNAEFKTAYNLDVISYYLGENEIDFSISIIRKGLLLGQKNFHFQRTFNDEDEKILNYTLQYYLQNQDLPDKVLTSFPQDWNNLLLELFEKSFLKKIEIQKETPSFRKLLQLAFLNAQEKQALRLRNKEIQDKALDLLKNFLHLEKLPRRLECYDVAIWQGEAPCASQITFIDGLPSKKDYRYYHLEKRPEGNNDFAMMKEVFTRRLEKDKLPDLFIVDGGKAQVSTVRKVLNDFSCSIPVVGIAKSKVKSKTFTEKNVKHSEERLIFGDHYETQVLDRNHQELLMLITQMRDEAHRFSRKLHHKTLKKRQFFSWIDEIEGLGPKKKEHLLKKIEHSPEEMANWNQDKIQWALNVSQKLAQKIYLYLQNNKKTN